MAETLRMLREEHVNLAKLLDLVEEQLDVFERGEAADYELISVILDYCQSFPDQYHHPKEDLILDRLKAKNPSIAATFESLENEHRLLAEETAAFAETVTRIIQDSQVSRAAILDIGRAFVRSYRRHMRFEEDQFFPAAEHHLDESDWGAVDARLHQPDDPLFGEKSIETYRRVRDIVFA
jgi:hemerythrin-like domain-containing protein